MLSSPQPSPVNQLANTSETNTSDRSSSKDLSQILVDIKSCRWRHFRPRTSSLHDSDSDELSSRKLHRSITRTGAAQPGTHTGSTSTQSKSSSGSPHCGTFLCGTHRRSRVGSSILLRMWSVTATVRHLKDFFDLCSLVLLLRAVVCVHVSFLNHNHKEMVCCYVFHVSFVTVRQPMNRKTRKFKY